MQVLKAEYFNIILENVKVTGITPTYFLILGTGTHSETIQLRYGAINTGNIAMGISFTKIPWNHRATA